VQEAFVVFAAGHLKELRRVLRESSDTPQRALAAQVLGYVTHKQGVVGDLVHGMSDPSRDVRNNSARALALFAGLDPVPGRSVVRVPPAPFVRLLHSRLWTDRNKASLALVAITARRDPSLLDTLRRDAMTPLIEMARWKTVGHATAALTILGRIGGQSEDVIRSAVDRGERERLFRAALDRR
jgi:hypothetical protein